MTLPTTKLKDRKAGDGVTSVFNFSDVPVLDKTWIKCQRLDADTGEVVETYTQGAGANQFQVTLAADYTGFTVTLGATATAALTDDYELFAYRDTPVLQETSFPYDNNIPPKTIERLFDRIVMALQESADKANLSVRAPVSFIGTADLQLPAPSAGRVIGVWNDAGDAIVEGPTAVDIANAQDNAEIALEAATAASNFATAAANNAASVNLATFNVTGTMQLSGDISPAQLTANTNNWAPTGLSGASVIRVSTDASRNVTGITGGADGRLLMVQNIGSFDLVLTHEDAASTAANRIVCPSATNLTIPASSSAILQYDPTSSRWRVIASPPADNKAIPITVTFTTGPSGTNPSIIQNTNPSLITGVTNVGTGGYRFSLAGGVTLAAITHAVISTANSVSIAVHSCVPTNLATGDVATFTSTGGFVNLNNCVITLQFIRA
jgi:hypothetical protein